RDGITPLPELKLVRLDVALVVVLCVPFAAIGLRFDQDCAATTARKLCRLFRHFVAGDHVVAVNDVTRNAVAGRFVGEIFDGRLQLRRRRIGVPVIFGDNDQWQTLDGGEV